MRPSVVPLLIASFVLSPCATSGQPAATSAPATKPAEAAKPGAPAAAAPAKPRADSGPLVFFSTQFKPVEEAEKMRQVN